MNQEQPNISDRDRRANEMQKEFDLMLDEARRRLKKWEELEMPIPEKLYHVTTRENAEQIMKEGLDPAKLIFDKSEVVSLSDDIPFALDVVSETQNTIPEKLVVLEIDTRHLTPSRIRNYLKKADPDNTSPLRGAAIHEVHYESTIPPEAIKIIKYKTKK